MRTRYTGLRSVVHILPSTNQTNPRSPYRRYMQLFSTLSCSSSPSISCCSVLYSGAFPICFCYPSCVLRYLHEFIRKYQSRHLTPPHRDSPFCCYGCSYEVVNILDGIVNPCAAPRKISIYGWFDISPSSITAFLAHSVNIFHHSPYRSSDPCIFPAVFFSTL